MVNWNNVIIAMEFTSLLFLAVLVIASYASSEPHRKKTIYCRLCLILSFLALVIEIISYALDGIEEFYTVTFIADTLSYAVGSWIIITFAYYVTALINEKEPFSYMYARVVLFMGAAESIMAIVGAVNGKTFTYENLEFDVGPWAQYLSAAQLVFTFLILVLILTNAKKLGRHRTPVLLFFVGSTVITSLMEIVWEDLPSFYFVGQALSMSAIYVVLQAWDSRFALRAAQKADVAKTEFLFNMSHDIRTPLNAITGYTALAKRAVNDPQTETGYLDKIDISSRQLLSLVNQVLEMSRIEAGKAELNAEPADVIERAQAMKTIIAADAAAKNIRFELDISDIRHKDVLTDAARMNRIVTNILGNAVKYTPEGGTVHYTLREHPSTRPGYGLYEVTITDTGIGMSEEFRQRLFDPFTRENTSTVSHIEGTGLGMAIVKRTVDLMGGSILVESQIGKGTTVAVTVPMKFNDGDSTPAEEEVSPHVLEGKRILLVEDNEMNREIAEEILSDAGMIVETADDGDVAVDMVRAMLDRDEPDYYDAVLMDIQMPRMNGYDACRIIRALTAVSETHLPIIALSANAFREDKLRSLEAGMDDHVAKPIDIRVLTRTLARHIRHV